jgi:hypothetical protein
MGQFLFGDVRKCGPPEGGPYENVELAWSGFREYDSAQLIKMGSM